MFRANEFKKVMLGKCINNDYKIDRIKPPSTLIEAPFVADASELA